MKTIIWLMAIMGVLDAMFGISLCNVDMSMPIGALGMMAIGAGAGMAQRGAEFGINRASSREAQSRQYEYQTLLNEQGQRNSLALMDAQRKANKEFYDYTYDKESYKAQVKQLQEAGLNIGLMYKGAGGVGGQTANVGSSASGGNAGMNVPVIGDIGSMGIQYAQAMANINLMNAQANKVNVEANKIGGVDTQVAYANLDKLIAETQNVELKNIYTRLDTELKSIDVHVASMTQEALISKVLADYQKAQEEATQAMLKTNVDKATIDDKIQQMHNATKLSYLELEAKKLGLQLSEEQLVKMSAEIDKILAETDASKRQILINESANKWQTQDVQLYKLWSEVVKNGTGAIGDLARIFGKKLPDLPPTKYEETSTKGGTTYKQTSYER